LLFEQADINNDGRVSYEELIKILRWYDFDDGQDIPSKVM
jgi:Ca2+-binding EF-hand superfamily protein